MKNHIKTVIKILIGTAIIGIVVMCVLYIKITNQKFQIVSNYLVEIQTKQAAYEKFLGANFPQQVQEWNASIKNNSIQAGGKQGVNKPTQAEK